MRSRIRQAMGEIDWGLRNDDPRLAGLLDMFSRLNAADAMPPAEQIRPRLTRISAAVVAAALAGVCAAAALIETQHTTAALISAQRPTTAGASSPAGPCSPVDRLRQRARRATR